MLHSRPQVYVVYPAALFDGWEVVREPGGEAVRFGTWEEAAFYARDRAAAEGGGVVKQENWFGDTESVCEVPPRRDASSLRAGGGPTLVLASRGWYGPC